MTQPRPEWIGIVVRYPDGSVTAIEMPDDGRGCLDEPTWSVRHEPYTHTSTITVTTYGEWRLYRHEQSPDDPFKPSVAIAAGPGQSGGIITGDNTRG